MNLQEYRRLNRYVPEVIETIDETEEVTEDNIQLFQKLQMCTKNTNVLHYKLLKAIKNVLVKEKKQTKLVFDYLLLYLEASKALLEPLDTEFSQIYLELFMNEFLNCKNAVPGGGFLEKSLFYLNIPSKFNE